MQQHLLIRSFADPKYFGECEPICKMAYLSGTLKYFGGTDKGITCQVITVVVNPVHFRRSKNIYCLSPFFSLPVIVEAENK